MHYRDLAETYDSIESTSGLIEKTRLFSEVLKNAHASEVSCIVALTIGKLYPDWKGEPELGVAEKMAVQVVAAAASIPERDVLAGLRKTGDIGLTAQELLTSSAQSTLSAEETTVKKVYDALLSVARSSGQGSAKEKVSKLVGLLADADPIEAKYILRTVTGDLRLGLGHMSIIDALALAFTADKNTAPEIERAFNLYSDLPAVAQLLAEKGVRALRAIKVEVGRPILMMAAKKLADAREILQKTGGKALVEYKYDGERIQIHKDADRVVLFSRREENITEQYPDVVSLAREGIIARRCVVEGECVAVDPTTGHLRPFQELMRRRRKTEVQAMSEEIPVSLFLFDVLFHEDKDVTSLPMPQRRALLEKMVKKHKGIQLTKGELIDDPERLEQFFNEAIQSGHEGIIAKAIHKDSTYQAGARSWLWIKLKASYKENPSDSMDLVVVGALHGRGKRTGVYGAILASVYDAETDTYPTVCKIGTGFTDDMLAEFKSRLDKHILAAKHPSVQSDIEADVWFEPVKVIEVIGDQITVSPTHLAGKNKIRSGGLAIRFPRFTGRWRDDKGPEQATTVDDLLDAFERQRGTIDESDGS